MLRSPLFDPEEFVFTPMDDTKTPLNLTFCPHPLVRNTHIQTIFSSFNHPKQTLLQQSTRTMIIDAGDGVRLEGLYTPQAAGQAKGLVLLLHGWLGSADSVYKTLVGEALYRQGYAIFRLNLRDHGDTHHLNPGIFRSDLLDETFNAAQRIAALEPDCPFHIIGFSLGGSFALRIAWRQVYNPIPTMGHTLAVCPVIDPHEVTLALDNGPKIYLNYFRRKWRHAYRQKMAAFPELYNFSAILKARTCMSMTEAFVGHIPYPSVESYFDSYTVTPAMMAALRSPVTILCAADDPVVPVSSFAPLRDVSPYLHLSIQPYGGHVGFIDIFPFRLWLVEVVPQILERKFKFVLPE